MKASQVALFTSKEDPKDAQVTSHRLLARAGFIKKQASGFYVYMPFGWQVHRKLEEIIREEMDRYGGVEVHLPVLTPAELWKSSGRWDVMGPEMMRMSDRHQIEFCLGPTHEESITWLAAQFLQSYKQLPVNLYQIGTKYRDEIRPRYGLIRCREFVMKDAYSFHADQASLDQTYQDMRECYRSIFQRVELKTIPVQADSGAMGGSGSEEFMVASEIGEETLLICEENGIEYRSNQEKTEFFPAKPYPQDPSSEPASKVATPGLSSIEEVSAFLKTDSRYFIKAVVYENSEFVVLAFVPGDRELNEAKLKSQTGIADLELASENTIRACTGSRPGFTGPVGLKIASGNRVLIEAQKNPKIAHLVFDRNLKNRGSLVAGANEDDHHLVAVQEGRDFHIDREYDLVQAQAGDLCPANPAYFLTATKGIEVGHIFKLGQKYSQALNLNVLDEQGRPLVPTMGCYGIGVGRVMATIVEQNHDDKGLVWPEAVSPYQIYLIGISKGEEEKKAVDHLYQLLQNAGLRVYYDDRNERPGVKFNDADLVGFPWQVIAGKNYFENGKLELKNRRSGEKQEKNLEEIFQILRK